MRQQLVLPWNKKKDIYIYIKKEDAIYHSTENITVILFWMEDEEEFEVCSTTDSAYG